MQLLYFRLHHGITRGGPVHPLIKFVVFHRFHSLSLGQHKMGVCHAMPQGLSGLAQTLLRSLARPPPSLLDFLQAEKWETWNIPCLAPQSTFDTQL